MDSARWSRRHGLDARRIIDVGHRWDVGANTLNLSMPKSLCSSAVICAAAMRFTSATSSM